MNRSAGKVILPWALTGVSLLVIIALVIVAIAVQPSTLTQLACGFGDQPSCDQVMQVNAIRVVALLSLAVFAVIGLACLIWAIAATVTSANEPQMFYQPPVYYGPPYAPPYGQPPGAPPSPSPQVPDGAAPSAAREMQRQPRRLPLWAIWLCLGIVLLLSLAFFGYALWRVLEQRQQRLAPSTSSQPVGVLPTATLVPLTLPPQPTPTSATGAWSTTGDTSTGWGFDVASSYWTLEWACAPEHDPHGGLAVRIVWGDGQILADTGVQPCTSQVRTFTLSNAGRITVELCENADFTTTPQPNSPPTIDCASGAVRWTISSPTPSTGNVGWS